MIPVTVTFYGDVGFDRSYNHVIDFKNTTQRNNYFEPKIKKRVPNCAYNKPMNAIQITCPYTDALEFTYCSFEIGSNRASKKEIFAWVDDVIVITDQKDDVTGEYIPLLEIKISVDVWQTFLFEISLGESFVVREHVDRFKANGDGTRGWCLPTTSSSNNVGVEKRVKDLVNFNKTYEFYQLQQTVRAGKIYWIVIQRVVNHEMQVYLFPFINSIGSFRIKWQATQDVKPTLISTIFLTEDRYLTILGFDPETVANVSYIPYDVVDFSWDGQTVDSGSKVYDAPDIVGFRKTYINTQYYKYFYYEAVFDSDDYYSFVSLSREFNLDNYGVIKPSGSVLYSKDYEPELFKNPYKRVSIIDEHGIEKGQLPDICNNVESGYNKIIVETLIDSVECRLRVKPKLPIETNNEYWIDYQLTSIDVIRNAWLSYLLQERETTRQMISSQINQQAIASAIGGVSSATGMGGQAALGVDRSQIIGAKGADNLSIAGMAAKSAGVGLGTAAISSVGGYIANKHFAFEQQDIREKQIQRKANNVTQAGTFKSRVGYLRLCVIECDNTLSDLKAKEFHKYGYSVFFYETPDIKSRKYFNFIATNLVKIEGNLNNDIKIALAEIFNNGVTIWHGDYIHELTGIGDYSKENIERSLI